MLIGDSKYDALGAKEIGIDFIAVTYGFGFKSANDTEIYDCAAICKNTNKLLNVLGVKNA